jgi:membrane associated rhomboid family serine protease
MRTSGVKKYNGISWIPFAFVFILWLVFWFEIRMGINLNEWGIYPRKGIGLRGIIAGPFIHGSALHLYQNTIPLLVLLHFLCYFFPKRVWALLITGWILTGLLTWFMGRSSYHIGASGLIYFMASFIFFNGVRSGYYRRIALSLVIVFLYGGMVWYVLPIEDGISWEGHLSGAISGIILAFLYPTPRKADNHFVWQKKDYNEAEDPFMKHFDTNGNFISESEMPSKANGVVSEASEDEVGS